MKKLIAAVAVAVALLVATEARASVIFNVNTLFNGANAPTSTTPWLIAQFETIGSGAVRLTLTSGLEVPSEFISEVAFNVNPSFMPSSLTMVQSPSANPLATAILHTAQNAQNLTGGGAAGKGFDFRLRWSPAGGPSSLGRFDSGDVASFLISGTGLLESDFDYTNTGSSSSKFAAHIQGIPLAGGGTTSSVVEDGLAGSVGIAGSVESVVPAVPEPASMLLLGTGLAGLLARRRFRA